MFGELSICHLFGPGSVVIDVGSWDNIEPSITLASMKSSIFVIDRYQRMVEFKEKIREAIKQGEIENEQAERIYPMKADANKLPFPDESIDGVLFHYSTFGLQQFGSELLVIYKEVKRVLKEGGIVILLEPTVTRAKEQESFLKTQVKTNRIGTIVLGRKIEEEEFPFDLGPKDLKFKDKTKDRREK